MCQSARFPTINSTIMMPTSFNAANKPLSNSNHSLYVEKFHILCIHVSTPSAYNPYCLILL